MMQRTKIDIKEDRFNVIRNLDAVVKKIYQYAEPNLSLVGWMGFIGFPLYYFIWTYIYPQAYENEWLRGICTLLLFVLALRNHAPHFIKRYLPYYYVVTVTFCLPFFFSFMMMMNGWSTVWAMSFMSSIFLHILLVYDTRVMLLQAFVSVLSAYLIACDVTSGTSVSETEFVWAYVPIFLFTYIFGNLFYFRNQVEHETKVSIAKSFGAGIAHEMRNPLSAIKTSLDVLESSLPSTKNKSGEQLAISRSDVVRMNEVLASADEIVRSGNETIDLLLTSIDQSRVSQSTFIRHSAQQIVQESLDSYSFKSDAAQRAVSLQVSDDFDFFGSDILLKYALYNLLKNALYYQTDESFKISISLVADDDGNRIYFEDNGVGIESTQLEHIFKDFYTSGKSSSYGLGLPFCKRVMTSFGGTIECDSELGKWTQFTLMFPKYHSKQVSDIKRDVLKNKSILYVGKTDGVLNLIGDLALYAEVSVDEMDCADAQSKEEYEFEYDLIFIDLDLCTEAEYLALESKLHFTEARIVVLYDDAHSYHNRFSRFLSFYPVAKKQMLEDTNIIDQLFFGVLNTNRNDIPRKPVVFGKKILIADDNDSMRSLTKILLNKQGFQVVEARNGAEALDILSRETIDLILMDIEMPVMDGFEATTAIRCSSSEYAQLPIIGHTGDDRLETLQQIKSVEMNDYLIKPADKAQLLDKIALFL